MTRWFAFHSAQRILSLAAALAVVVSLLTDCGAARARANLPVSWNRHVHVRPALATIPLILGTSSNALGGATRGGGWYSGVSLADRRHWVSRKVVSGADQKRLVPPPTWVGDVPVFVQVNDVEIVSMYDNGDVPGTDHDTSANACMVGRPRSNLTCIHIEIDGQWKANGWAPPDFPMHTPIDVQGYVYWDRPHSSEGVPLNSAPSHYMNGHYETGWEIHPVSAWRLHNR